MPVCNGVKKNILPERIDDGTGNGRRNSKTKSAGKKISPAAGGNGWHWAAPSLHKPQLLFLDEATSGADPIARRKFWQIIQNLAQSGRNRNCNDAFHGRSAAVLQDRFSASRKNAD